MKRFFLLTIISVACLFAMAQTQTVTHVVQRGETIESIAKQYHVSVDDINKANPNADGMVYVGMKLVVPVGQEQVATGNVEPMTVGVTNQPIIQQSKQTHSDSWQQKAKGDVVSMGWERNKGLSMFGVTFFSQDFRDVKLSGHYGITVDYLNISGSLFGFNLTLASFNYGLVDKDGTSDLMLFGPNISYEIVRSLYVCLPLQAMCNASFEGTDTKTSWGWAVSPRMYYSFGKLVINAGLMINGGFKKGEDATCGFTVGLGFDI